MIRSMIKYDHDQGVTLVMISEYNQEWECHEYLHEVWFHTIIIKMKLFDGSRSKIFNSEQMDSFSNLNSLPEQQKNTALQ